MLDIIEKFTEAKKFYITSESIVFFSNALFKMKLGCSRTWCVSTSIYKVKDSPLHLKEEVWLNTCNGIFKLPLEFEYNIPPTKFYFRT